MDSLYPNAPYFDLNRPGSIITAASSEGDVKEIVKSLIRFLLSFRLL